MKIEIDLQDILGDEYGDMESLANSIERQLVDSIQANLSKGIQNKVDSVVAEIIASKVAETAEKVLPALVEELVDKEYQPVGRYGDKDVPTTMRKELLKVLTSQMIYKSGSYSSDKNFFTNSIDDIISAKMKEFKTLFDSKVDEVFTKEAFDYALVKMNQKFKMGEVK
ncbi:MAG: hypothetical protein PF479_09150 [Oceanispirochaeta sp.]|jgi:hypothetical protein|nr:hypothetical protein [Oceanispirochaeta sp.]